MNSLTMAAGIIALAAVVLVVLTRAWETDSDHPKKIRKGPLLDFAQRKGFSKLLRDLALLMVFGIGFMLYHNEILAAGVAGGLAFVFGYFSLILVKGIGDTAD